MNPRHDSSSACVQGFLKPQCDHVTCWRKTFRGMRESWMLGGGEALLPTPHLVLPTLTASLFPLPGRPYPAGQPTLSIVFMGHLIQVLPVRLRILQPQLTGCLLSEAFPEPSNRVRHAWLWAPMAWGYLLTTCICQTGIYCRLYDRHCAGGGGQVSKSHEPT